MVLEAGKSKIIRVPVDLVPGEATLPGLQPATFAEGRKTENAVPSSSFCEDADPIAAAHAHGLIQPSDFPKASPPDTITLRS